MASLPLLLTRKQTCRAALMIGYVRRHAIGVELWDEVRHHPFVCHLQGFSSRKERSRMAILAHSQKEKVMAIKAVTRRRAFGARLRIPGQRRADLPRPESEECFPRELGA